MIFADPIIPVRRYVQRRKRLLAAMLDAGGGVALLPTAKEMPRNRDAGFPYRHDSYFYYLTGFAEPEAVLALVALPKTKHHKAAVIKSVLFCRPKHQEREIWDGFRYGPAGAQSAFAFDEAFSIDEISSKLVELMHGAPTLFHALGYDADFDAFVTKTLNTLRAQSRAGTRAPEVIVDVRALLDEMRLVKDADEIKVMRAAADISSAAHARAMRFSAPGKHEFEVEAELLHEFRRAGSEFPAYTSIVATGGNACVLHYRAGNTVLQDGDLCLIDAGCELQGYASDITRTYPVNGRFSTPQRELYELVLRAQAAAAKATKPGAEYHVPHEVAVKVLAQGMIDVGLCKGSLDSVLEKGNRREGGYFSFYMHRTGHWLGMDVHDAGEYKNHDGSSKRLQPGNVVTIEPGIYVRPAKGVPKAFWNIGIRIEDDALLVKGGCELITAKAPKTVAEIEAVMQR